MENKSSSWAGNLVFFFLGAAVGAAVALLYAPQEGGVTRRVIGEKASDMREKATGVTSGVAQTAKEKLSAVTDKARDLVSRVQHTVTEARDDGAQAAAADTES